jgi:hypothetical protein
MAVEGATAATLALRVTVSPGAVGSGLSAVMVVVVEAIVTV